MDKAQTIRSTGRARGSAMVEMALVLPVLMIILLLVVFFGRSMVRKQNVIIATRHAAWRNAKTLAALDEPTLVQMHFPEPPGKKPTLTTDRGHDTPADAAKAMVNGAYQVSDPAGEFADTVVNDRFPGGERMWMQADFPPESLPLEQFSKTVMDRHVREGVAWQRRHTDIWREVRDQFIEEFDNQMTGGGPLTDVVRNLYLRRW